MPRSSLWKMSITSQSPPRLGSIFESLYPCVCVATQTGGESPQETVSRDILPSFGMRVRCLFALYLLLSPASAQVAFAKGRGKRDAVVPYEGGESGHDFIEFAHVTKSTKNVATAEMVLDGHVDDIVWASKDALTIFLVCAACHWTLRRWQRLQCAAFASSFAASPRASSPSGSRPF